MMVKRFPDHGKNGWAKRSRNHKLLIAKKKTAVSKNDKNTVERR
jgi:hypothetical protein